MPHVVAVSRSPQAAIVSSRQDCSVPHDHRTDVFSIAGAAGGHLFGDFHEVFMPFNSFVIHGCASLCGEIVAGKIPDFSIAY
jgi:hypothetical protein